MSEAGTIAIKRAYEPPMRGDGQRVLVDRIWPRGVSREEAALDLWLKDIAPSTALRKWFGHDPARWDEFRTRYRAELERGGGGAIVCAGGQGEGDADLRRARRAA